VAELLSIYPPATWFALLATGVAIGLLGGLLGVGGGIIAVPVLLEVFRGMGLPTPVGVPLAIGTAQASVLIASLTAAYAHWRRGTIDTGLVKAWLPALIGGTALGLILGPFAPPKLATGIFAVVTAALGLKMILGDRLVVSREPLSGPLAHVPPVFVGGLAAALGIGGGTLSTPVLSLFSFPIQRAIGAGSLFNLIVGLPATVVFLAMGWHTVGRPVDSVGDVALFCVAALSLPALFVAPLAAHWSTRVPASLLRRAFAFCLIAIAVRVLTAS
jgi:uncharacterized membrane protein YfcA